MCHETIWIREGLEADSGDVLLWICGRRRQYVHGCRHWYNACVQLEILIGKRAAA